MVTGACTSEVVTDPAGQRALRPVWRTKDSVDVLALPGLDVVAVEHWETGRDSHASVLMADRLEGYHQVLKALFGPPTSGKTPTT